MGRRDARRSVAAMKPARTQATVVKKPKTFWIRVKEECILGDWGAHKLRRGLGVWLEMGGLEMGGFVRVGGDGMLEDTLWGGGWCGDVHST